MALQSPETINERDDLMSLDAYLALGADARVEIVQGACVEESPVGMLHHLIAANLQFILTQYVRQHKTGLVFPGGLTYLMNSEVRGLEDPCVPGVSYLHNESIPADFDGVKPFPGVPELAVEVVWPGDAAVKMIRKVRTYLDRSMAQVWVIYPESGELHQYRQDAPDVTRIYRRESEAAIDIATLFP